MPITKSAKKAMRVAKRKTEIRKPFKSKLKTMVKKVVETAKKDKAAAAKILPEAFKTIDTAAKKNIIHKNNASRKKSRLAKLVSDKK